MSENNPAYNPKAYMKPTWGTNAPDPKKEREAERKRLQELNDLVAVLSTDEGLRLFRKMIVDGNVFKPIKNGNAQTYIDEAKRELALRYYNMACEGHDSFKVALTPPYLDGDPYEVTQDEEQA